jgi:hypothetical protein
LSHHFQRPNLAENRNGSKYLRAAAGYVKLGSETVLATICGKLLI